MTASNRYRWFLFATFLLLPRIASGNTQPPHVIVFLADDQGWGDLSLHGNANLNTPRIDSLAADGAEFERFYVCPVCAPTRAEFFTGRYHPRSGVRGVSRGAERMNVDETTIADVFRAAGYATAAFGKWHNGTQYPYHPCGRGFDEFYGFCSGHWGNYFSPPLDHNGRIVQGDGYVTDDFTSHAMAFIEANRGNPFFVFLPYCTPHSPMQVPDRWYDKFAAGELAARHRDPLREDQAHTRAALAMCENIDWNVGRVLDQLDQLDLAENTIVVYFSDNGPNGFRFNDGMKGRKGTTDEGGVRSPLFIRCPNRVQGGHKIETIAGAIDLLPTLCDLAGIPLETEKPLDGRSLKPLLEEPAPDGWPARMLFSHWGGRVSVRTQSHRLDHEGQLFDMEADPGQHRNIASDLPQLAAQLAAAVDAWRRELLTDLRDDDRPFLVGHPEFATTLLPARDGQPQGTIQRSSRHPNCSFFTGWTRQEDAITWDVEVLAAGNFEAELYYACKPGDVGAVLELTLGDERCQREVDQPHDPPLRGAGDDRVPRRESYVKDFRPISLGTLDLKPRRGTLTLRAIEKPGDGVVEVRALTLTRVSERGGEDR